MVFRSIKAGKESRYMKLITSLRANRGGESAPTAQVCISRDLISQRYARHCSTPAGAVLLTFEKHPERILLRWTSTHSNARMEGLNGLFQAARARARGYRNTATFITMIHLIAAPPRKPIRFHLKRHRRGVRGRAGGVNRRGRCVSVGIGKHTDDSARCAEPIRRAGQDSPHFRERSLK